MDFRLTSHLLSCTRSVLLLLKVIHGTKQAASRFWVLLQSVFLKLSYKRSNADTCMFHKWSENDGLVAWLMDDCLCTGKKESVEEAKEEFKKEFEVDDIRPLVEYVGCKIDYYPQLGCMLLTQQVLIQSVEDEFQIDSGGHIP